MAPRTWSDGNHWLRSRALKLTVAATLTSFLPAVAAGQSPTTSPGAPAGAASAPTPGAAVAGAVLGPSPVIMPTMQHPSAPQLAWQGQPWSNPVVSARAEQSAPANGQATPKPPGDKPPVYVPVNRPLHLASFLQADETDQLEIQPSPQTQAKLDALVSDMLDPEIPIRLDPRRSKLLRTRVPVSRVSITDPEVMQVTQFSPTEFELVGLLVGETSLTLWFGDGPQTQVLRYLVEVGVDTTEDDRRRMVYGELERRINELFPNSFVQLIPVGATLIVRGQARDGEEAAQILQMITGATVNQLGEELGPGTYADVGTPERPFLGVEDLPASNIVNMLMVPGEQMIMLKVRVAELTRTAERGMGADLIIDAGDFRWESLGGIDGAVSAILDTDELFLSLQALSGNGYSKILAEPNLVTLNGQPASFFAGGQFAVPTAVGIGGIGAVSTSFASFGVSLTFTPSMIDKDRFRLIVAPNVSAINNNLTVGGIPGLNSRGAFTTVDLREGQWMAIAGLLQDQQNGAKRRVPYLGDIPILDTIFSQKAIHRDESELIILVSPELVHPLEAEEVPLLLPGMEVTEPTDCDFFLFGRYEGRPCCDHRSTIEPIRRDWIIQELSRAHHEARGYPQYQVSEDYYIQGEHGFSH